MSYVHITEIIRKISSSTGEVLFVYPADTVLDRIIPDLWPNIINNIDNNPFAIGKYDGIYPNYHLVTKDECYSSKFIHIFKDYYLKNNGILSIDDLDPGILFLEETIMIKINEFCLYCFNPYENIIKKGTICVFKTCLKNHKEIMLNFDTQLVTYIGTSNNIKLFIRDGYVF